MVTVKYNERKLHYPSMTDLKVADADGVPARSGSRTPASLSVFGDGIDRPLYKVVLTGGPCAGKTTSMVRLTDFLRSRGFRVYIV